MLPGNKYGPVHKPDRELRDPDLITRKIDFGDAKPIKSGPYRLNPEAKKALGKHLDMMLKNDIIEESSGSS